MSVVVQLRGGLGNQLFQYAAGFAFSAKHTAELLLDRSLLPPVSVSRGGISRWPEQISSFAHAGSFIGEPGGATFGKRAVRYRAQVERSIGDSRYARMLGQRVYARENRDDAAAFIRAADAYRGRVRINAYCTSAAFFSGQEAALSGQVRSIRQPGDWYLEESQRFAESGAIALHVRWGDYLNLQHIYGVTPADYYRRAVELIERQTGGKRPVWLFSDDPIGAADYLAGTVDLDHVVVSPDSSSPLENLLLLSQASAIVGANSTFSWWAAFLSAAPAGSVVFPRPLFGPAGPPEPRDWLQPDWVQLGR